MPTDQEAAFDDLLRMLAEWIADDVLADQAAPSAPETTETASHT